CTLLHPRHAHLQDLPSFPTRRSSDLATNAPIQGTAADILKLAMIALDERLGDDGRMLLTVHDEIVIEVPEARAEKVAGIVKETRSEEHTSELQSLRHLVCRLLLEKKN